MYLRTILYMLPKSELQAIIINYCIYRYVHTPTINSKSFNSEFRQYNNTKSTNIENYYLEKILEKEKKKKLTKIFINAAA